MIFNRLSRNFLISVAARTGGNELNIDALIEKETLLLRDMVRQREDSVVDSEP